jgi:hypothetical protein
MKTHWLTLGLSVLLAANEVVAAGPEDSILKEAANRRFPNVNRPWTNLPRVENAGSGVVMADNGIPRRGTSDVTAVWEGKTSSPL